MRLVLNSISGCVSGIEELSQEKKIKELSKEEVTTKFLEAFDINDNK